MELILWFLLHDVILVQYVLPLCVFLSVCPSVTSQCSVKIAKHRIKQTKLHDSPGTLV